MALIGLVLSGCGGDAAAGDSLPPPTTSTAAVPESRVDSVTPSAPETAATIPTFAVDPPVLEVIGTSLMGRPISAATLGTGEGLRVFVVGNIHGDERAGSDIAPMLLEHLAAGLPAEMTIRIVLDANPDGTVAATRGNRNGVDLNRNWPTQDFSPRPAHGPAPLSEPESAALFADISAFDPDLILALHSAWEGPFVNFDGPGAWLAGAFAGGAAAHDRRWTIIANPGWSTPGSMGTYFGRELGLPAITLEPSRYESAAEIWPAIRAGVDFMLYHFATYKAERDEWLR